MLALQKFKCLHLGLSDGCVLESFLPKIKLSKLSFVGPMTSVAYPAI